MRSVWPPGLNSARVATQIRNLLGLLIEADLAATINPVIEQQMGLITRITWRSPRPASHPLGSTIFATVEEYRCLVEGQVYSAVLYDGALIQMSHDVAGSSLVGHRLCYYPCPFDIDADLLRSEPIGDVIAFYSESKDTRINLRSPCRFDYAGINSFVINFVSKLPVVPRRQRTEGCLRNRPRERHFWVAGF